MDREQPHRIRLPISEPKLEHVMLTGPDLRRIWQVVTRRSLQETHATPYRSRLPTPDPRLAHVMLLGPDMSRVTRALKNGCRLLRSKMWK